MGDEDEGGGFRVEEHGAGSGEHTLGWNLGDGHELWCWWAGQVGLGHMVRDIEGVSGHRYKVAESRKAGMGWSRNLGRG